MQRGFPKRGELGLVIVSNEVFTQAHWASNNWSVGGQLQCRNWFQRVCKRERSEKKTKSKRERKKGWSHLSMKATVITHVSLIHQFGLWAGSQRWCYRSPLLSLQGLRRLSPSVDSLLTQTITVDYLPIWKSCQTPHMWILVLIKTSRQLDTPFLII